MELRPPFFLSIDKPSGAKIMWLHPLAPFTQRVFLREHVRVITHQALSFRIECPSILRGCEPLSATHLYIYMVGPHALGHVLTILYLRVPSCARSCRS
jgi:hypothetical protein